MSPTYDVKLFTAIIKMALQNPPMTESSLWAKLSAQCTVPILHAHLDLLVKNQVISVHKTLYGLSATQRGPAQNWFDLDSIINKDQHATGTGTV